MADRKEKEINKSETALNEERILARWKERKIFEKTLGKTKDGKPFVFYDGPPFATGEPHYGHILAGTIKDAIPRYQTMKGRYVRRQWGWDCHGLPVENEVEKELNLPHKKDIEAYGIGNFNEAARRTVLRYDSLWKEIIPRMGRFVDMERAYKTMDATYTESIWWAFKTLYDKGFAYEGHKVMYVCPRCETPLSQNEVALGYTDLTDISVTVKFELLDANMRMDANDTNGLQMKTNNTNEPKIYLLAWTTTPWTLPGNTAVAVGSDIDYVKAEIKNYPNISDGVYVFSKKDYENYKKEIDEKKGKHSDATVEILKSFKGSELVGKSYKPLFDYYAGDKNLANRENGWRVYAAPYVTTETGTGIVHLAPAYGEEDLELARKENLPVVHHVGIDGRFKPEVKDFADRYVKQKGDTQSADVEIIKYLSGKGLLFSKEKIVHSYPLCWRCDTPLLNYATPSWFVKVTEIRDKIVSENKRIGWVPKHVGEGRFGKWLLGARDWAISRSRFWGAPLPVWKCAECDKVTVFGGVEELSKKASVSGNRYFVIRHGESEGNHSGTISSDPTNGDHLTEKGKMEVKEAAEKLKDDKVKIDRIISSNFTRTKETAEILASELGLPPEHVVIDPRIHEINTGVFNGKKSKEYHDFFSSYLEKFTKTPPGGENLTDVKKRVLEAVHDADKTYRGQTVLFVTHEYPSWMLFATARGATKEEAVRMKEEKGDEFFKNAEVRELKFPLIPRNPEGELDFHRPYVDEIVFDCECGGISRRIPEVFDCWFESGSMPYAQFHYPFENKEEFEKNFPADFIAEGLDQTRGWFYSLLVLSAGLFGETPYRHVIVNGIILAEDGQKMSKRLKNYPDPTEVADKYGADALRYYLLSSPVVRGEDIAFSEKGVGEVYKKNIARLKNVYAFYELYGEDEEAVADSENILDIWILTRLNQLISETSAAMDSYELDKAAKPIADFIDDLSTWYLRRSRERFKSDNKKDKETALETTKYVLTELSKVLAPFMPFIADDLYLKVTNGEKEPLDSARGKESVHLESWPETKEVSNENREVIDEMRKARGIVSLGLEARAKAGIKVRQPLQTIKAKSEKLKPEFTELVKDEVNVKGVVFDENIAEEVLLDTEITPKLKEEGDLRDLIRAIQDFRKESGLTPKDKIELSVVCGEENAELIKRHESEIKKATLLSVITVNKEAGAELSFGIAK